MDFKFKLSNIEVSAKNDTSASIGEVSIEVTDLNLPEYLQLVREIPSIIKASVDVYAGLKQSSTVHPPGADTDGDAPVKRPVSRPNHKRAPVRDRNANRSVRSLDNIDDWTQRADDEITSAIKAVGDDDAEDRVVVKVRKEAPTRGFVGFTPSDDDDDVDNDFEPEVDDDDNDDVVYDG